MFCNLYFMFAGTAFTFHFSCFRYFSPFSVKSHRFVVQTTLPSLLRSLIVGETKAEISEDIGDLTGFVGCMSACLNFLWYHSRWSRFFNRLLDFKQFGTPPGYVKVVRRGNLTTLACILYTIPGMLWYSHLTHLDIPRCEGLNREFGMKEACGMVNPTWIPPGYDRNGWRFWVLYVLQCTGIFVYLPSNFVISNIPLEAVGVIVTRINHLKYHLKRCGSDLGRLYHCVKYHQDIIEYNKPNFINVYEINNQCRVSKELSDLVQATMGTLLLTGAVVIGSLGSQVIKASTPKAVTFILGYVTTIFMVCHAGQKLINQVYTTQIRKLR